MRANDMILRCYVENQGDVCVAVCIDLTLAAQGDSLHEAKNKLEEQIASYLHDIFVGEDRQHIRDLFPRRAPLGFVVKYQWIRLKWKLVRILNSTEALRNSIEALRNRKSQAFGEFWPGLIQH